MSCVDDAEVLERRVGRSVGVGRQEAVDGDYGSNQGVQYIHVRKPERVLCRVVSEPSELWIGGEPLETTCPVLKKYSAGAERQDELPRRDVRMRHGSPESQQCPSCIETVGAAVGEEHGLARASRGFDEGIEATGEDDVDIDDEHRLRRVRER